MTKMLGKGRIQMHHLSKIMYMFVVLFVLLVGLGACQQEIDGVQPLGNKEAKEIKMPKTKIDLENLKEIYYAGGCFWGVEAYFALIPGVYDVTVGYANGHTAYPTYEEVCKETTGHAETVHVKYDPNVVSLETLTEHFFGIINPLSYHRQGNDVGSQYRTGIYYMDKADLPVLKAVMQKEAAKYDQPLAVELKPLTVYYLAEDYHQDYLEKNPNGYCHVDFSGLQIFEKE